jgi:hypothetical protein
MNNFLKRWLLLIIVLFIAIFFMGAASKSGIVALFVLGILFESVFWYLALKKKKVNTEG